jgi:hypothetical protein
LAAIKSLLTIKAVEEKVKKVVAAEKPKPLNQKKRKNIRKITMKKLVIN